VRASKDAEEILRPLFADVVEHREAMMALYLNRANRVIGSYLIGLGGVTGVVADPKIIFQAALKCNACGIILSHNHPSGNSTPSQADIDLTRKVREGAKLLELSLLDHLIILPDNSYYSFADEGHL
jgi:DNA repair protein RadC